MFPFFSHLVFFFPSYGPFTCTPLLNFPEKSNVFKGWLAIWGKRCMLILQDLAVKFALVFDPVAQLFVFPAFHVRSFSMSMLEIKEILELIIPIFLMMVLFLLRCLSSAIIWFLWLLAKKIHTVWSRQVIYSIRLNILYQATSGRHKIESLR